MRGHRDLQRASVAAVVCAVVAVFVPFEIVRVIAAVPLTLFLPGYAITAVCFRPQELAPPKLWTLSTGISLMILALGALLLNVFPFGLTTLSWAVLLVLVIVACCRAAALRWGRPQQRQRRQALPAWRPSPVSASLVALAVVISIGALVLAQRPLPAGNAVGFTALWMLPANSQETGVVVGVLSSEQDPTDYILEVAQARKAKPKAYRVSLDPGEEKTFEIPALRRPGGRAHVVASLYLVGRSRHLYRRVTTWLPRQKTFPQKP
jgi:uncharacterized membrane protein